MTVNLTKSEVSDVETYLNMIRKQISDPGGYKFNPKLLLNHLKAGSCGRFIDAECKWPLWRTIDHGNHHNYVRNFYEAFDDHKIRMDDWVSKIVDNFLFCSASVHSEENIDLCKARTKEIVGGYGQLAEIFKGIEDFGGGLLTAEMSLCLRDQYRDQPEGEQLLIAMQPVALSGDSAYIPCLERQDNALWIRGQQIDPVRFWDAGSMWAFRYPQ